MFVTKGKTQASQMMLAKPNAHFFGKFVLER